MGEILHHLDSQCYTETMNIKNNASTIFLAMSLILVIASVIIMGSAWGVPVGMGLAILIGGGYALTHDLTPTEEEIQEEIRKAKEL